MELPFLGPATAVGDPQELCVTHKEVNTLHAAAFLFFIDVGTALPPVAVLIRVSGASLVIGR